MGHLKTELAGDGRSTESVDSRALPLFRLRPACVSTRTVLQSILKQGVVASAQN